MLSVELPALQDEGKTLVTGSGDVMALLCFGVGGCQDVLEGLLFVVPRAFECSFKLWRSCLLLADMVPACLQCLHCPW